MAGELTRSRIEAFDQTAKQLSEYAARWRSAAGDLDQTAQAYVSQIANPSGTQWQGQAAAAALDAAHTDRVAVLGAVMHAHDMADTAELGSSSLLGAREGALQAIAKAEADDFIVGEDLSVADRHYRADPATYAARMAQAQAHLGYIEHHAGLLEAENQRVAAQLNAGAAQMNGMMPTTWTTKSGPKGPKAPDNPRDHKPTINAVDNRTFKDAPPDDSGDEGSWRDQPSPRTAKEVQDALGQLQRGDNKPHRQMNTPEELQEFWDWLKGNSAGHAPSSAPFPRERLDDGTIISFRPDSKSGGETIGVTPPGSGEETKVHLPTESPIISGLPQLPGVHGTPIPTQPPTIMPGVPLPASPPPAVTTPTPGPGLLPQIGHDLAEAGKKAAIGGLIGVAIIGGLLGIGPAAPQGAS